MTGTATAAAASSPRKTTGGGGSTAGASRGEDRELNRGFLAGALRAGNLLLLVDDNFFEALVAVFADIFVDRHELIPSEKQVIIASAGPTGEPWRTSLLFEGSPPAGQANGVAAFQPAIAALRRLRSYEHAEIEAQKTEARKDEGESGPRLGKDGKRDSEHSQCEPCQGCDTRG